MSSLAKTIAIASTLGLGYVAFKYINSKSDANTTPESNNFEDKPSVTVTTTKTATPSTTTTPVTAGTPPTQDPPIKGFSGWFTDLADIFEDQPKTPGHAGKPGEPAPAEMATPLEVLTQLVKPDLTPLAEPEHPRLRQRINRSKIDSSGTVVETPSELLAQARIYDRAITMDELTGARLAVSEHSKGSFTELCSIVDSELNRARRRGKSLFKSLTYRDTFGRQDRRRRAATRQDPTIRHLLAARAVLSGKARGISQGAVQFFDPEAMDRLNVKYRLWRDGKIPKPAHAPSCDALELLEAWSFDYGKKKGHPRCPPDRSKQGTYTLAWVGPIPGVDPFYLMLMKRMPLGTEHTLRYRAARDLIIQRRKQKSP